MMLSPESVIDYLSDKTYDEIIKERDRIIREIRRFEKNKVDESEWLICPSPDVRYQCNLEYLAGICKLLLSKYQNDEMIIKPTVIND